jgi:hypothetical protein
MYRNRPASSAICLQFGSSPKRRSANAVEWKSPTLFEVTLHPSRLFRLREDSVSKSVALYNEFAWNSEGELLFFDMAIDLKAQVMVRLALWNFQDARRSLSSS